MIFVQVNWAREVRQEMLYELSNGKVLEIGIKRKHTWEIHIVKQTGTENLGLELILKSKCFEVNRVRPGTLIDHWNKQQAVIGTPEFKLRPGDLLLKVRRDLTYFHCQDILKRF